MASRTVSPLPSTPLPPRWSGPRGFGARHIHDDVPFSLWDEGKHDFRHATAQEMTFILTKYEAGRIAIHDILIILETAKPPTPVPLTVACTPAIFVPPGRGRGCFFGGETDYASPRVADPCPQRGWGRNQTPTKSQMGGVVSALLSLAEVRRVNFWPRAIVVELVYGDGRVYQDASLPWYVAGFPTTYHHDGIGFFQSMRDQAVQDKFSLDSQESILGQFSTNTRYCQAEPPTGRLVEVEQEEDIMVKGAWFRVDGVSTDLLSLQYLVDSLECPPLVRPPPPGQQHPTKIPVLQWRLTKICRVFRAATSAQMIEEGLCGALIVEERTGNVGGVLNSVEGDFVECVCVALVDDIVEEEEGWVVV